MAFHSQDVLQAYENYPLLARQKLYMLRELILEVAFKLGINDLEETLKWSEPSYLCSGGSTIRLAWRSKYPGQFAIFFNCKTSLVDTFREVFSSTFTFEGNRAIVFKDQDEIPIKEIKQCIELALRYKQVKHLPLLGL